MTPTEKVKTQAPIQPSKTNHNNAGTAWLESELDYFEECRDELAKYLSEEQIAQIRKAYLLAHDAHQQQFRRSGEAYITHPVAVASVLAKMRMDAQSIMAALMHDVIEDTPVEKQQIREQFGEDVAELVDGVSKLTKITFETQAEAQAENFRKMVLAMVRDIRVIIIKLADRLHNMRTLSAMPAAKRKIKARETLDIYAPIANRLGMHSFYIEFQDLAFATLYPMRCSVLKRAVDAARGSRREIINKIEVALKDNLEKYHIPASAVWGREKHLYSIYRKMRNKGLTFVEVMDIYGFRIIVDSVDDCYRVLGIVHNLYKPLPERFKDYIAIPKANGYQSLHTTLFGPYGVPIEIQIRTTEMDQMAECGIAAHWLYKTKGDEPASEAQVRAREWLKDLLEMQNKAGTSLEFIENVKIDLFPDEVYVFTPKGHIMELPSGACSVDFAYAVHSDIGSSCVAAKIDRRLAPLSAPLRNGQTVEIISAPAAQPNPAWLNFVVTGKARSSIRNFIKSQRKAESVNLGERLLENALASLDKTLADVADSAMSTVLQELHYACADELYEAIGLGNQLALLIARRLLRIGEQVKLQETVEQQPLLIKGSEGMVVSFAECCRPIPNDPIVGLLSAGHGLIVHAEHCQRINRYRNQPEKFITVRWEEGIVGDFKVDVRIDVVNQRGVLAKLATEISDAKSNIDNISVEQTDTRNSIVNLTVTVRDRNHLATVMRRVRHLSFVIRLNRNHS